MQIGIDSFAINDFNVTENRAEHDARAIGQLLDRMVFADQVGLDSFGIGEHYRQEFLDSAPAIILAAAGARTENIRLTSAVTVLSTADPVRVFQNFATIDLITQGRVEMVVGRGSSIESFPLFGYDLGEYDQVFAEKLELFLTIRDNVFVNWSGRYRPRLDNLPVYPRPLQDPLPVWLGVGGTPGSFARAGYLGLPLMVAVIGGETRRFRPLVDLYREAWLKAGHPPEGMQVGLHSLGYVGETSDVAIADYYPGYIESFTKLGKERGFPAPTRASFDAQNGPTGAYLVGSPEEVAQKILRHSQALGGISRFSFQMDVAKLSHDKLMQSIDLIGREVAPRVRAGVSAAADH
jgi:probable LLM family oxidoreductase